MYSSLNNLRYNSVMDDNILEAQSPPSEKEKVNKMVCGMFAIPWVLHYINTGNDRVNSQVLV